MNVLIENHRPDASRELAARLALPLDDWVDLFGWGWVEQQDEPWHDYDLDPDGGAGYPVTHWHTKGDPMQLMVRVFTHGVFIARPEGTWPGHVLKFHASGDQTYIPGHELMQRAPETMTQLLRARRRRFRWCPGCWQHTAPEKMMGDVCMGCFDGVF